jgi:ribonuclease P protein component
MEEKFLHAEGPGAEKSSRFQTKADLNSASGAIDFALFDLSKLKGKYTFSTGEKLKSQKIIDLLFKEGKSVSENGFTLVYLYIPIPVMYPAQAGFAVPKKHFKHANQRNRVKRLMRETYRLNKYMLYEKLVERQKQLAMMWVYKGKELPDAAKTQAAITKCIQKLASR